MPVVIFMVLEAMDLEISVRISPLVSSQFDGWLTCTFSSSTMDESEVL